MTIFTSYAPSEMQLTCSGLLTAKTLRVQLVHDSSLYPILQDLVCIIVHQKIKSNRATSCFVALMWHLSSRRVSNHQCRSPGHLCGAHGCDATVAQCYTTDAVEQSRNQSKSAARHLCKLISSLLGACLHVRTQLHFKFVHNLGYPLPLRRSRRNWNGTTLSYPVTYDSNRTNPCP